MKTFVHLLVNKLNLIEIDICCYCVNMLCVNSQKHHNASHYSRCIIGNDHTFILHMLTIIDMRYGVAAHDVKSGTFALC